MARLAESPATLNAIREKALRNALNLNTYGTRASFEFGPTIVTFAERCEIERHLNGPTRRA